MFSGGRDSSLTVCKLAIQKKELILLNFVNGTNIGGDICSMRYDELKNRFPDYVTKFVQLPTFGLFRKIALIPLEQDVLKYKKNLVCIGCKLAAQTEAIIYCKSNKIDTIADGYNLYQADKFPEQNAVAISAVKDLMNKYGIDYINPIYQCDNQRNLKYELFEFGITTKSIEGTCVFSSTNSIATTEEIIDYINSKIPMCVEYINKRINEMNYDV